MSSNQIYICYYCNDDPRRSPATKNLKGGQPICDSCKEKYVDDEEEKTDPMAALPF